MSRRKTALPLNFIFARFVDTEPTASTSATASSDAGDYAVSLSGGLDSNYDFDFVEGTLSITKAILTAIADDKARHYGEENPLFTVSYSGFKGGDDVGDLDAIPVTSTPATRSSDTGEYPIILAGGSDHNYSIVAYDGTLIIEKASQIIIFNPLDERGADAESFMLTATASSGLPVRFTSSNQSVVSIDGSQATPLQPGTATITASQDGNANYQPAPDVEQLLVILPIVKLDQQIIFNAIEDKTFGNPPFSLQATTTSGLAVSFSTSSDKVTLNGVEVTIVRAGRVEITANQEGNDSYNAAAPVTNSFCVIPEKPTMTMVDEGGIVLASSNADGNQWYRDGSPMAGETGNTLQVSERGTYKVNVTADDCISEFSDEMLIVVTGIEEEDGRESSLYPNPVKKYLYLSGFHDVSGTAIITDVAGRTHVTRIEEGGRVKRADVQDLAPGVYQMWVSEGTGVRLLRFVKE